jgi:hypothetical protein
VTVYLFISDVADHADLAEGFSGFTDVRPSRPSLALRQVVLISFDGETIAGVGRMSRSTRKAANYKWHVRLDELILIDEPIPIAELAGQVSTKTADVLAAASRPPGGQLGATAAAEVLDAFGRLTGLDDVIEHLRQISAPVHLRRTPSEREAIVDYERDAVGLALEFAGLTRERNAALSAWDGRSDEPFLTGIANYRVLEDRALEHDARVFGDWDAVKTGVVGATRFESQGKRVTVINVNRAGIERAIGVDLIYYSQTYDAYVVVQYKRREASSSDERWVFRPNAQFDAELERMRQLPAAGAEVNSPVEYRLDASCAFLKLCAPTTPDAFTADLVNGVYLPLEYWDVLEKCGLVVGPKGGRALVHTAVGRYFTNSLFIDLVRSGWIGSRAMTSELIGRIISGGLDKDHDLILAAATSTESAEQPPMNLGVDDELPF